MGGIGPDFTIGTVDEDCQGRTGTVIADIVALRPFLRRGNIGQPLCPSRDCLRQSPPTSCEFLQRTRCVDALKASIPPLFSGRRTAACGALTGWAVTIDTHTQGTPLSSRAEAGSFWSGLHDPRKKGPAPGPAGHGHGSGVSDVPSHAHRPSSPASSPPRRLLAFARPGANPFRTAILATPEEDDGGMRGGGGLVRRSATPPGRTSAGDPETHPACGAAAQLPPRPATAWREPRSASSEIPA